MFWVVIGIAALGLFKPDLAKAADEDVIRKASLTVLLFSVGQAALRANYAKYRELEKRADIAESVALSNRARSAQQTALGNFRNSYLGVMENCISEAITMVTLQEQMAYNNQWAYNFVLQHFNGGEASLLNTDTLPTPDPNVVLLMSKGHHDRAMVYMEAQHRANALRRLIEGSRSILSTSHTVALQSE